MWSPTTLIFGSGGVKGYLEVGALLLLSLFIDIRKIKHVIGISVGSVLALLLSCGYNCIEIASIAINIDINQAVFKLNLENGDGLIYNGGLFSFETISKKLKELVKRKTGKIMTLNELHKFSGIDFVVVSTDLENSKPVYISYKNYPNLSCVKAVMLSINIPFVFGYQKIGECFFVDGALSDPMPIDLYPSEDQLVFRIIDKTTLGDSLFEYLYASMSVPMNVIADNKIREAKIDPNFGDRCRILELRTDKFNPVDLQMGKKEKQLMIKQGLKTALISILRGLLN